MAYTAESIAPLDQNSALQLFARRSMAIRPNFSNTPENAAGVREICSRLDGLPLAIELGAARSKVLSAPAMLFRLQKRLQLMTGGALDVPERQQALRKTIDRSHDLLTQAEQKLFWRCGERMPPTACTRRGRQPGTQSGI